jgi:SNF2 family DNA or RNA helicase
VVFRPSSQSQQCAIVVDPHVARELRDHQVAGVQFLFNSLCGMSLLNNSNAGPGNISNLSESSGLPRSADLMVGGAILADEMGLGKTLQAIALIWTLLKQSPFGCQSPLIDAKRGQKIVIITPSTLVKNWLAEINLWLKSTRLRVSSSVP